MAEIPPARDPTPESSDAEKSAPTAASSEKARPSPHHALSSPAVPDERLTERPRRRLMRKGYVLSVILAVICGVLVIVSVALYPRPDNISIPSYAIVRVISTFSISTIAYQVTPEGPAESEITITIRLPDGTPYPPVKAPAPYINLDLPPRFVFRSCPARNCSYYKYNEVYIWHQDLSFKPAPTSVGIGHTGQAEVNIFVKASDFGYASNGITAEAAIPQITYSGPGSPGSYAEYDHITSPDYYDWSASPPLYVDHTTISWGESLAGGEAPAKVNIGINHANQTNSDRNIFVAGALIGLAGGALLSAVQEAFHAKDRD